MRINTRDMKDVRSYVDAERVFNSIKPFRGKSEYSRPLGSNRRDNKLIVKLGDGSYACRLYQTDVVTYHPDGSVTLRGWASQSTDAFASCCTPYALDLWNMCPLGPMVLATKHSRWDKSNLDLAYSFKRGDITMKPSAMDGTWIPVNPDTELDTIRWYKPDGKATRAALKKYPYADFCAWLAAFRKFSGKHDEPKGRVPYWQRHYKPKMSDSDMMLCLNGGVDGWKRLADECDVNTIADQLRDMIYRQESSHMNLVKIEEYKALPITAIKSVHTANRAWGRYA